MNCPKVTIAPVTSAEQPYVLKLDTKLLVTVTVESDMGQGRDYQLKGSTLPPDCYTLGSPAMSGDQDHHDQIEVLIHPTQVTAIGEHQLHLQLEAPNGEILWESQIYLQFLAADDIEIMLTPDLTVVEDGVGLYQLLITNTSRLERVLTLQPKGLPAHNGCVFKAEPSQITLGSDQTGRVELMVQPQRWWLRPWFGNGRKFRFQVDLQDTNGIPLPQLLAQGALVWRPYPRTHSLKLLGLLLLGLGASSTLLWQLLLRKPVAPAIATLSSSQTVVPQTGQKDIQLSWTIQNSQRLSKLVLLRESQGKSEIAKTFWFNEGIPQELQRTQLSQNSNFCQFQQPETSVLECTGITTGTQTSGNYKFKLQAFSEQRPDDPVDIQTTQLIAFKPNAVPLITRFYAPTYRSSTSTAGPIASASSGPIKLNWDIANPGQLTEVQIMTVDANNAEAALLQRYRFSGGQLPDTLKKYCTFNPNLNCQNLPTAANKPGEYYFKLTATYQQDQQPFTIAKTIGPMKVQSGNLRIASFLINGQNAPAKYVLKPGEKHLKLAWKVVGGNNPSVAILPNPGKIPASGSMQVKVNPQQPGVITLQATDLNGKQVLKTVAIGGNLAEKPSSRPAPLNAPTQVARAQPKPQTAASSALPFQRLPLAPAPAVLRRNPPAVLRRQPVSIPITRRQPAPKPVVRRQRQVPRTTAAARSRPRYSQRSLEEARTVTKGLVVARQKGKIVLNGSTWNKTQDAITLLRRGYSRQEAAQRAGVPLWKLNVLVSLGQRAKN